MYKTYLKFWDCEKKNLLLQNQSLEIVRSAENYNQSKPKI